MEGLTNYDCVWDRAAFAAGTRWPVRCSGAVKAGAGPQQNHDVLDVGEAEEGRSRLQHRCMPPYTSRWRRRMPGD
jgi:hypothetical protein